jgi:hypothetical protein
MFDWLINSFFVYLTTLIQLSRLCRIEWQDDLWIGKDIRASGRGPFQGIIPEFTWRDRGKLSQINLYLVWTWDLRIQSKSVGHFIRRVRYHWLEW